ncbi:MAG: UvrD-helicase domain-containing protein [Planctomycetia bacterium]|nr:MAG: UvrD-helicase domain-containing protein [Planctomycetia bacterium]
MDTWVDIRRKARQCHEEALRRASGNRSAIALTQGALAAADLDIRRFEPGTTFGKGVLGVLERSAGLVNVVAHLAPPDEAVIVAHELGHYHLHLDPTNEVTIADAGLGGDRIETGAARVEGYSPRERKEVQADVFAGEFLCPSDWAREEFRRGRRPSQIAAELGLPNSLVLHQVIRAVLLPPVGPATPQASRPPHELDESQHAAATWKGGPLLVDAGPGTGKTRTLIRRITHLLENAVRPGEILALTFSNKAAEEMRERLAAVDQQAAIELWVGTFHAFGLELITKWPSNIGRTPSVRVLDETESLALLEHHLAELPLHHFQNLYEPAYELVNILRAISRCKDELISPAAYLKEAAAASSVARTDEEREQAERVQEIGEIYRIYEEALKAADAVDFGDLVLNAAVLVEGNPAVREHIARFKHVLVDEYQDVNFASARLLRAIRAAGADIWVVADQRQSIYRFRGAEPTNVARFADEFNGERLALTTNYRSHKPVVDAFQHFSAAMGDGGSMAGEWIAHRLHGGGVTLTVAPDLPAEAEAIRDKIEALRAAGVPYREQAILGRSHLTLARVTAVLEKLGVPLLYLGDLFEREDIRDLLSLVAIDAEFGGIGLIRVAGMPRYGATRADALTVIRWAQGQKLMLCDALKRAPEIEGLSDAGRNGLGKLGQELEGLGRASAWTLLTTWLFERSDHLAALLASDDIASQQSRIAIYHLLKVCSEQAATGDSRRKRLLARIRRIEALSQDSSYRTVASEAADIDAVRVMTIHGSKGLEFQAVHFPALATGYVPASWRGTRCDPPPSLTQLQMEKGDHDAEEECLFFVALSRARDFLSLSRAERYTARNASASAFLTSLPSSLPRSRHNGAVRPVSLPVRLQAPAPRQRYTERELDVYMRCPTRYRYEAIDGLHGARDDSAYIRFHRCVYVTVGWLEQERGAGRTVNVSDALTRLDADWKVQGPVDHAFAGYYFGIAKAMVTRMAATIAAETGQYAREEWAVPIGAREVLVTPDRVLLMPDRSVRVQRIRTGRESQSEAGKPIYALLRRGGETRHPGLNLRVETFYLATGNTVLVPAKNDDKRLKEYADAIAAIERGEFAPTPEARMCPNCQCYFTCGA